MNTYPENATLVERLDWYRDYDIQSGLVLYELYMRLEESWSIDVEFT